jgi:hypothetical protein
MPIQWNFDNRTNSVIKKWFKAKTGPVIEFNTKQDRFDMNKIFFMTFSINKTV